MKAHVFISVIAFHFVVIAGLYLLSACSSSSNGTSASQGGSGSSTGGSIYDQYQPPNRPSEDNSLVASPVETQQENRGIDPAFNSGSSTYNSTSSGSREDLYEPRRPGSTSSLQTNSGLNEFREDEVLQPVVDLAPVTPDVEYVVKKGDSLWKISREFGLSLKTLLEANGLTQNSTIQAGQTLVIPSSNSTPSSSTVSSSSPASSTTEVYTVVKGDTLSRIAKQFNTTVDDIQLANGLPTHIIQLGQRLTIPVNSGSSGPKTTTSPAPATQAPRVASSTPPANSSSTVKGDIVHIVGRGETPSGIAKKYGITTAQLMQDNSIKDPRKIFVGQELQIRLTPAQTVATPPPATTRTTTTTPPPAREPVSTPTTFDESLFDDLEGIPEVEVVPQE